MKIFMLGLAGGLLGYLGDQAAAANPDYAFLIGLGVGGFLAVFATIVGN